MPPLPEARRAFPSLQAAAGLCEKPPELPGSAGGVLGTCPSVLSGRSQHGLCSRAPDRCWKGEVFRFCYNDCRILFMVCQLFSLCVLEAMF